MQGKRGSPHSKTGKAAAAERAEEEEKRIDKRKAPKLLKCLVLHWLCICHQPIPFRPPSVLNANPGASISKCIIQIRMILSHGSTWSIPVFQNFAGLDQSDPDTGRLGCPNPSRPLDHRQETGNGANILQKKGEAGTTIFSKCKYNLGQCWCVLRLYERQSLYWVNQLRKSAPSWKKSSAISNKADFALMRANAAPLTSVLRS